MQERRTYNALNAMRGVAALVVAIYHADDLIGINIFTSGYLAVDFFFVLSGFIITHAYGNRMSGGMKLREFVVIRMARFYPLYILGTSAGFTIILLGVISGHSSVNPNSLFIILMLSALFVPNISSRDYADLFPLNVPSWSLFFELIINVLFVALSRWMKPKIILAVVVSVGAALCICTMYYGSVKYGFTLATFHVGALRGVFSFMVGVLIYRFGDSIRTRIKMPAGAAIILLAVLLSADPPEPLRPWFDILFVVLLSPALVISGAVTELAPRWTGLANFAGTASFVVYALHAPTYLGARAISTVTDLPLGFLAITLLIVLVLLSSQISSFYDEPARRFLSGRLREIIRR